MSYRELRVFGMIFLLAIILVIAWFGLYAKHSSTPATTAVSTTGPTPAEKSAVTLVQSMYDSYNTTGYQQGYESVKNYVTPELYQKITATHVTSDQVLCAQNHPQSMNYSSTGSTGAVAHVVVLEKFGQGSSAVKVDVNTASNLVSAITCPKTK